MLFNTFQDAVDKYSNQLAINDITYSHLYELVLKRSYTSVSYATDWTVLLDVLKAASLNKGIAIMPKFKRELIKMPITVPEEFGIVLFSSGSSSGIRKEICMPERMVMANAKNAIQCQAISNSDKILTVCSLNHTGGLSAQTIAGLLVGAHNIIEPFNAFNFFRLLKEHNSTITHLIPAHIDALIKVDPDLELPDLRLVVAGSDCVFKHHVDFWNSKGKSFIANYGMTEAGPIIINHKFVPGCDMSVFEKGVPLGTDTWAETKIVDGELYLKGDAVTTGSGWLATGDCVEMYRDWFIYKGRKSAGCKIIPKAY